MQAEVRFLSFFVHARTHFHILYAHTHTHAYTQAGEQAVLVGRPAAMGKWTAAGGNDLEGDGVAGGALEAWMV